MRAASDLSINPRRVAAIALLINSPDLHPGIRDLISRILRFGAIRIAQRPGKWIGIGIGGTPLTFMRGAVFRVSQDDYMQVPLLGHSESAKERDE